MRPIPLTVAALLALSSPAHTFAQASAGEEDIAVGYNRGIDKAVTLDFTTGPLAELFDQVMKIAKGLVLLMLLLALFLEAFGKAPEAPREYGAVLGRFMLVLVLLVYYSEIFGTVINLMDFVASKVSPSEVAAKTYLKERFHDVVVGIGGESQGGEGEGVGTTLKKAVLHAAVGVQFDALVTFLLALCELTRTLIERLGKMLVGLFYLLGPLALVAAIPRNSHSGGMWLKQFITFCTWPIFTGILMNILLNMSEQARLDGEYLHYLGAMASALVFALAMIAAPILAGSLVGGGVANLASAGLGSAKSIGRDGMTAYSALRNVGQAATAATGAGAAATAASAGASAAKGAGGVIANKP
jgi:hypothetical protein